MYNLEQHQLMQNALITKADYISNTEYKAKIMTYLSLGMENQYSAFFLRFPYDSIL